MPATVPRPLPSSCTRRTVLGALASTAFAPTLAAPSRDWPPSIALDYDIQGTRSGMSIRASGRLSWQCNSQAYQARLQMSAWVIFRREQISAGDLNTSQLQPRSFEDHQRRIQRADFDPGARTVRYSSGVQKDWPVNGQDRVSMLVTLGRLAARALTNGESRVSLPISDGRDWQHWTFDIAGRETVDTAAGAWPSVRLRRSDARGQDTQLWLAPNLHGLPVRLLIREANGDVADQRLRAHQPLPTWPA